MEENLVPQLITPEPNATSFTVNGITYTKTEGLAVARLRIFQRYSVELGFDTNYRDFQRSLQVVKRHLNKLELADGAHELGKLMDASDIIGATRLRDVELCGLFYNSPTEDPTKFDFEAHQKKCYEAWASIHGGFFFVSALSLLNESLGAYNRSTEPPSAGSETSLQPSPTN